MCVILRANTAAAATPGCCHDSLSPLLLPPQGADMKVEEPQLFPDLGIWHPCSPGFMYEDLKEYLNW